MERTPEDQRAFDTVRKLFRNDYDEPFEMTPGQISLFRAIYEKQHPRIQFDCYTQYGKSDVVSMAVLLRATTFAEKWPIVGATKDKASIIMNKLIKHIFENDYTMAKFEIDKDDNIERIKRERSKEKVSFKVDEKGNIGTVFILSADARRKTMDAGDILIGHGAPNLILDDAALINDLIYGKALRMLGGHAGKDFLLKITNSFGRNHAFKSSIDPKYKHIIIDYKQGIAEGRLTEEYVEEMRRNLDPVMFGILYECVYPPESMIEQGEWLPLITPTQIEEAQKRVVQAKGNKMLGCDIAEGTNYNAFVIRTENTARLHEKTLEKDLMKTADKIVNIGQEQHILDNDIFVDATGIGSGVYARVKQMGHSINSVKAGEKPSEKSDAQKLVDPIEFMNLRAEMYWKMKKWIEEGGALEANAAWKQLEIIRYRTSGEKKIQIMSKEEMRARGYLSLSESTDIPDALSLTFSKGKALTFSAASPLAASAHYYPDLNI